jgi:hypothetical protein
MSSEPCPLITYNIPRAQSLFVPLRYSFNCQNRDIFLPKRDPMAGKTEDHPSRLSVVRPKGVRADTHIPAYLSTVQCDIGSHLVSNNVSNTVIFWKADRPRVGMRIQRWDMVGLVSNPDSLIVTIISL